MIKPLLREALLPSPVGADRFVIRATHERGVGVPSSRSLATASREAVPIYINPPSNVARDQERRDGLAGPKGRFVWGSAPTTGPQGLGYSYKRQRPTRISASRSGSLTISMWQVFISMSACTPPSAAMHSC